MKYFSLKYLPSFLSFVIVSNIQSQRSIIRYNQLGSLISAPFSCRILIASPPPQIGVENHSTFVAKHENLFLDTLQAEVLKYFNHKVKGCFIICLNCRISYVSLSKFSRATIREIPWTLYSKLLVTGITLGGRKISAHSREQTFGQRQYRFFEFHSADINQNEGHMATE